MEASETDIEKRIKALEDKIKELYGEDALEELEEGEED